MQSLPTAVVFLAVFTVAFGVTWGLAPMAGALGRRLRLVDVPGGRRRHQGAIPRLGGVAIFGGFMAAALLTLPYPRTPDDAYRLSGLLIGSAVIFVGGLLDDRFQFTPLPQMAITIAASLIAVYYTVFIERFNNPFTNEQVVLPLGLTIALTLFWMAGMTTTVNWMDGLDGLATGVSAIAAGVFFLHMLSLGQTSVALLALALLGATLGFLPHNLHPARIFIGSSGSYFLGYAVGALSIIGGAKAASALLVLGVPILDVAWQILNRIREGRSPGSSDRGHLHFRLVDMGIPQQRIVLMYYAFSAILGGMALLIPSRLYKFLALLVLGVIVTAALAFLSHQGSRHATPNREG